MSFLAAQFQDQRSYRTGHRISVSLVVYVAPGRWGCSRSPSVGNPPDEGCLQSPSTQAALFWYVGRQPAVVDPGGGGGGCTPGCAASSFSLACLQPAPCPPSKSVVSSVWRRSVPPVRFLPEKAKTMDVERVCADLLQAYEVDLPEAEHLDAELRVWKTKWSSVPSEMKVPSMVEDTLKSVSRQELYF